MTDGRGITGRHVLFMLIVFFGAIIAANIVFVSIALKSFPGESQEQSYLEGVRFNDTLAARAAQENLGWRAQVTRIERAGEGAVLELRLLGAEGEALSALVIEGDLKRPAHQGEDQPVNFQAIGAGQYRVELSAIAAGVWDLDAVASGAGEESFAFKARIIVP